MHHNHTRYPGRSLSRRPALGVLASIVGLTLASSTAALAAPASASANSTPNSTSAGRDHLPHFQTPVAEHSAARFHHPSGLMHALSGDKLLRPRRGKAEDQFGLSIAVSGDTALVGAPTANGGFGRGSGVVYVFVKGSTGWTQQARLRPSDAASGDLFGAAVALDGDTAVIGAQNKGEFFGGIGAAYVFVRSGSTWQERTELTAQCASCGRTGDFFGFAVGVSGKTALVSAPGFDSGQGVVFQFTRSGKDWRQTDMFSGSDSTAEDAFGAALSLSGDTAVIGAPRGFGGVRQGAAYIFGKDGATFVQQRELAPVDHQAGDLFGAAVAISGDTALVGAPGCCQASGHDFLGTVDVFVRDGDVWTQQAQLTASDGAGGPLGGDEFGKAVALSGDLAVIGAENKDRSTGAAYEFVRSGSTWTEASKFADSSGASDDEFGHAVAITDSAALIGSPHHDNARGEVRVVAIR